MYNDMELACELYEMTASKLANMREKFRKNGGEIPNNDVDLFDKLTHSLKSLKTTIAMLESEGEGGYSSNNGGSYYSQNYSQNNSYRNNSYRGQNSMRNRSRADGLHDMLDRLTDDKRIQVQRYIEEMERM